MLPFCGVGVQHVQAAGSGTGLQNKALRSRPVLPECKYCALPVCQSRGYVIDEFRSLQRIKCLLDGQSLNNFQGQAEEALMSQALSHLVEVFQSPFRSSPCEFESKGGRLDIRAALAEP